MYKYSKYYLEFVDEIVSLQQFETDVFERMSVGNVIDRKHVERPVFKILKLNHIVWKTSKLNETRNVGRPVS